MFAPVSASEVCMSKKTAITSSIANPDKTNNDGLEDLPIVFDMSLCALFVVWKFRVSISKSPRMR